MKNELKFLHILELSSCLIFYISDFHNLRIVNNIFFFIFEGCLIFLFRGVFTEILIPVTDLTHLLSQSLFIVSERVHAVMS